MVKTLNGSYLLLPFPLKIVSRCLLRGCHLPSGSPKSSARDKYWRFLLQSYTICYYNSIIDMAIVYQMSGQRVHSKSHLLPSIGKRYHCKKCSFCCCLVPKLTKICLRNVGVYAELAKYLVLGREVMKPTITQLLWPHVARFWACEALQQPKRRKSESEWQAMDSLFLSGRSNTLSHLKLLWSNIFLPRWCRLDPGKVTTASGPHWYVTIKYSSTSFNR